MKLYIPTSTLNFNNILSTESLSPQAFYALRGFGYKRWQTIPENGLAHAVTLYGHPFRFSRPASDVEDHPMWIEIETDEELPVVTDGIRLSDHTLYLSPWRTRFLFLTETDLRTTRSLSQQSAETKLTAPYTKQMELLDDRNVGQPGKFPKDDMPLNEEALRRDQRLNRMKGLLYGYYLGALLSEAPDVANKRRQIQDLRNDFYALWSASGMNQQGATASCTEIQDVFDRLRKSRLTLSDVFDAWTKEESARLDLRSATERQLLPTRAEEIVVADNSLVKIASSVLPDEQENHLFRTWVNEVLTHPEYTGSPDTFCAELADRLTQTARDRLGAEWETNPLRTQLNALRNLVRGNDNQFRWTDALTTAVAAALLWGDDWEKLISNLRNQGTTDYRLALALYGELTGFANLTRDLTDHLFHIKDRHYLADVYKEIYGQLLGTAADLPSRANKNPDTATDLPGTAADITPPSHGSTTSFAEFNNRVWSICESISSRIKRDKNKREAGLRNALEAMDGKADPTLFLDVLANQKSWGKKTQAWKEMKEALCPKQEDSTLEFEQAPATTPQPRFPFSYEHVEDILQAIREHFRLQGKLLNTLKSDLEYTLAPTYVKGKDAKRLLSDFKHKLEEGKVNKLSTNRNRMIDLSWKVELYKELDIPAIISYIRENFEV